MANVTAIIGFTGGSTGGRSGSEESGIETFWRHLEAGTRPASGGSSASPQPYVSRTRLLLDAANEAASATAMDSSRTGLFVRGDEGDDLASEVAGEMGLGGPVVTVGSLLAGVERAGLSLGAGECDLALAGEAPLGGSGGPGGEGASVLALKRLPKALADGDRVLALVRGTALEPAPVLPSLSASPDSEAGEEPGPIHPRPALADAYTPPANPLEAAIAGIWQQQLGIDRVGVNDNFFELGGTSIVGVKIIAALKEWLHQDIPTVSLYEGATVSALSKVLLHSGQPQGYDAVRERGERRRRKLQRLGQGARQEPAS